MAANKNIERICIIVLAFCVIIAAVFMNGEAFGISQAENIMGYESKLFDNSYVHTIAIEMENWDSFIETAENEEYSVCNVTIDGETIKNVGIRGKGNTSLSNVSSMGSQRYSFKIEFDQYDGTSTYHGLDKLSLNNLIQDSTFMKDYLVYTMMNEFGANAPLCSFVYITVNGEDWGLYLAVEGIEESFLQRNYGNDYGELYKPDSMNFGGGRGNGKGFDMNEFAENFENGEFEIPSSEDSEAGTSPENSSGSSGNPKRPSSGEMPDMGGFGGMVPPGSEITDMESFGGMVPPNMSGDMQIPEDFSGSFDESQIPEDFSGEMPDMGGPGGMMGGSGMGSDDVKLKYIDDDPESYSNIFNSAKTDITKADKTRLIESLETLSTGKNVEHAVDIEAVLRYFVVHNYVVNGDSYTGSMIHNYYLYEEEGLLSMIPWDYNLAFGTFQGSNASSAVNDSIDTPLSVSGSGDRPMADWIFQSEEYTELYHQYFAEFLETVDVQKIIEDAEAIIAPYIEKDPTKFYTFEEFEKGASTLKEFCKLRTESIESQLLYGEKFTAVDASHLNLSDMGSMGMGGGKGGFGGENFDRNSGGRGENPDESQDNSNKNNTSSSNDQTKAAPPEFSPDDFQIGGARNPFERTDFSSDTGNSLFSNVFYIIASAAVLAVGLVIVFVFKR